jgi:ATP-dependent DNA ligase
MAQITVDVPNELAEEAKSLEQDELNSLVVQALREGIAEHFMFRLADRILEDSELTDEDVKELADDVKRAAAQRHAA